MDLRYVANNQPSLCIPRVFKNIDEDRIRRVLDELRLGRIERIDLLVRKNEKGEEYKRVFVHFQEWFWNEDAQEVRRKLISGKEIKIVYDGPWFWKVSANNWQADAAAPAPASAARNLQRPRIEFDDEEDRRPRNQEDRRPRYQEERRPRHEERRPDERHYHDDRRQAPRNEHPHRHEDRRQPSHYEPKPKALPPKSAAKALPIAPTLKPKSKAPKDLPPKDLPIAPTLKPNAVPNTLPPKALPIAPTLKEEVFAPTYISMPIPVKSRQLKKKAVAEKKAKPALELEEGELVEVDGVTVSAEELQELDDLYGDLNI